MGSVALGFLGKLFTLPCHKCFLISDFSLLSDFLVFDMHDIWLVSLPTFYYVTASGYFEIHLRKSHQQQFSFKYICSWKYCGILMIQCFNRWHNVEVNKTIEPETIKPILLDIEHKSRNGEKVDEVFTDNQAAGWKVLEKQRYFPAAFLMLVFPLLSFEFLFSFPHSMELWTLS